MKKEFFVIAHNIRSAYNVGSIFRSADGMGVSKIYLTGYSPEPYSERSFFEAPAQKMITKTALGAEKSVAWERIKSLPKLLEKLKKEEIKLVALEQDKKSLNYQKFKPVFPLALIIGNEPKGIDKRILKKCDSIIEIPMHGKKNSLNVSVAFGIAGYEIISKI